ncbi:uncharacterized protein B0J16DRAFT_353359 [Fusarium flagelliforme]|uniref:uncharacterized protein n=1 Tax=Fusarium flagelliforme TaxID=2675880 RepID=UPI001E8E3FFA|nr:uncharacterized protein B0J16DRAFT_353359 [Fusarium flagelliforme]KAH7199048.1 hypothetical protein B0J16DRAFT_353359 [Fusarium flagelliforme]
MAFKYGRKFSITTSVHCKRRLSSTAKKEAINDGVYLTDFSVKHLDLNDNYVLKEVEDYEHEIFAKFIGAGLPATLRSVSKTLCSCLWLDLDIVSIMVLAGREDKDKDKEDRKGEKNFWNTDVGFRATLTTLQNYKDTCGAPTWETMMTYAEKLRCNKTCIAFFSSSPQGGGVALMRHALIRFACQIGVNMSWYVPKPLPSALRITKNIHNVLQGVSPPSQRITAEEKEAVIHWITENAYRYWFSESGPLRPMEEGGAHVIIINNLQTPGLIPLIKRFTPDRPVLYCSHIQIRSDLVAKDGSA